MKLALASSVGAAAEALEAHIDFHLGAGVDAIFIGASRADVPERLVRSVRCARRGARTSSARRRTRGGLGDRG